MGIEEFLLDEAEKKGVEKGIEKGIAKGVEKEKKDTALKMKNNGLDVSLIANITGLSIDEIQKL